MPRFVPCLLLALLAGCADEPAPPPGDGADAGLRAGLGGDPAAGFARAVEPREFEFPADHGPHPAFRNEWWYITGNVEDPAGRRYGFQVTFFRIALAPDPPATKGESAWATSQIWMAHLALTDAHAGRYHHAERFARDGDIGLAGARSAPLAVWLEDWRLERAGDGTWRLGADAGDFALDLAFTPRKPPVLHGDGGLSRKGAGRGNASYYYSQPRLATTGTVRVDGERRRVAGRAWLDREWSTSALGDEQVGWDWFALQLDDGTDVMIYEMRRRDGVRSRFSYAAVIRPDGRIERLGPEAFHIAVTDEWTSPRGGTYPAAWRVELDPLAAPLELTPALADQEFSGSVRYWEGAVDIRRDGESVGRGYVELSGYAEPDD